MTAFQSKSAEQQPGTQITESLWSTLEANSPHENISVTNQPCKIYSYFWNSKTRLLNDAYWKQQRRISISGLYRLFNVPSLNASILAVLAMWLCKFYKRCWSMFKAAIFFVQISLQTNCLKHQSTSKIMVCYKIRKQFSQIDKKSDNLNADQRRVISVQNLPTKTGYMANSNNHGRIFMPEMAKLDSICAQIGHSIH